MWAQPASFFWKGFCGYWQLSVSEGAIQTETVSGQPNYMQVTRQAMRVARHAPGGVLALSSYHMVACCPYAPTAWWRADPILLPHGGVLALSPYHMAACSMHLQSLQLQQRNTTALKHTHTAAPPTYHSCFHTVLLLFAFVDFLRQVTVPTVKYSTASINNERQRVRTYHISKTHTAHNWV